MSVHKNIEDIVAFLSKTLIDNYGINGYVLGLSGGIDSAVVAALAKLAIKRANMHNSKYDAPHPKYQLKTFILPINSNPEDKKVARLVAAHLGLEEPKTIYLLDAFNTMRKAVVEYDNSENSGMEKVLGNVKARLRMTTLYYQANLHNMLVLGTDNLTETYTGYFTKHGDGAADVFPISDFLKREVYGMARELCLPSEVINRPPSAGLWTGQTDEDEMGVPYDFIDNHIEGLHNTNNIVYGSKCREYSAKLSGLHRGSEHKRNPPHIFKRP